MRILHLVRSFGFGGAENHVRDLANILDETGHEVFLIAGRGSQNSLLNSTVRFHDTRMTDLNAIMRIASTVRFIKDNRIDIVHVHQRLPVFIGTVAAKIAGIPVVATVHGQTRHDIRSPLIRRWIDKFIFVRQSTYDEAKDYGIPAGKSVLIQNGVRILKLQGNRDLLSFCYISRIDRRHSQVVGLILKKVLIPLHSRFPGIRFNIVGDGEYLAELRSEAAEVNRQAGRDIAIIHGYLPDVRDVIKKAGLVLGVGRVAIETLACGVPVLSVNQKYFGGLVSGDNYPFFRKNNFVAYGLESTDELKLAAELEKYFTDPEKWQNEAAFLQEKIDEDFNILKITSSISDLYSETIRLRNKTS